MSDIGLLNNVIQIQQKYIDERKKDDMAGKGFNLFSLFAADHNEVSVCWVLWALLSNEGGHGMNDTYLRLFCEHVMKIPLSGSEKLKADRNVYANGRFIDLAVYIDGLMYPIEVKIYAPDQDSQCYDYYCYAMEENQHNPKTVIYYLTLIGTPPSSSSTSSSDGTDKLDDKNIVNISFKYDISNWLGRCLQKTPISKERPRINIIQFMDEIERWSCTMSAEYEEIKKLLEDENNRKSAIGIWNSIAMEYNSLPRKLYTAIDDKITIPAKKIYPEFKQVSAPNPDGVYYHIMNIKDKYEIRMRFSHDQGKVVMQYILFKNNNWTHYKDVTSESLDKMIYSRLQIKPNGKYAIYTFNEFEPDLYISDRPKIDKVSDAIELLFNEKRFNDLVNNCVEKAIYHIRKLRK